jgi:hypothetical protein
MPTVMLAPAEEPGLDDPRTTRPADRHDGGRMAHSED